MTLLYPTTDESPERILPPFSRGRQTIFGGLLSDTDSEDSEDEDATTMQPQRQQRRRRPRNSESPEEEEDAVQRRQMEEAIEKELRRIKERPKPKHEWNFVDQIVRR